MESEQIILCSFADYSVKDKPKGQACLYNIKTGQVINPVFKDVVCDKNSLSLLSETVDNNCHFISLSTALATFQVCCVGKEKPVAKFFGHEKMSCFTAEDDISVAGTMSGTIYIWQVKLGALLAVIPHAHFQAISVVKLANEYLITGGNDGTVKIWDFWALIADPKSAAPKFAFANGSQPVTGIHVGWTGGKSRRLLACSLEGTAHIYDLWDASVLAKFMFPDSISCCIANVLETKIYFGSNNGSVYFINLDSTHAEIQQSIIKNGIHEVKMELKGPDSSPVQAISLSFDESILIVGHEDGSVRFWDIQSSQILRTVTGIGAVTNILSALKSPIPTTYTHRSFPAFRRTTDSDSIFTNEFVPLAIASISEKTESNSILTEKISQLHAANNAMFSYIEKNMNK